MEWKVISFILISLFCIGMFGFYILNKETIEENQVYENFLRTDLEISKISKDEQKADLHYDLASLAYEYQNYPEVISNCKIAREYYHQSSQDYKRVMKEMESLELEDKLIDFRIESLGYLSQIDLNMYEACEHFESASRYYDTYFNTSVSYLDPSFDMGGEEIDMMNEKIRSHDSNVEKYNLLLEEIGVELNKRIAK